MIVKRRTRRAAGRSHATVAALGLLFVVLIWGPGRINHVESNPGPSGTQGSTIKNNAPPPAVPQ